MFTLTTVEGLGSFTPAINVEENDNQVVVSVFANNAVDLAAAYVHVNYDSDIYTPADVEISEFLGKADETISLALTNQPDVVPIGITQIAANDPTPRNGDGLLAKVYFEQTPFTCVRGASVAPKGIYNKVTDLAITVQTATNVTLRWTERNRGDYDNDGTVTIADLTPLGMLLYVQVASASDPVWAGLVDGDENGEVNLADLSTIGANFNSKVEGYHIYTDDAGTAEYDDPVLRTAYLDNNKTPVVYSVVLPLPTGSADFTVRAYDGGSVQDPQSDPAKLISVPGEPDAPTNLTTDASEAIGIGKIKLTWAPSVAADVVLYEVERRETTPVPIEWTKIADVPSNLSTYTDSALDDKSYDYRVRSKDFEGFYSQSYSNEASGTPYMPPPPSAPENVSASPSNTTPLGIEVSWDPPSDASAVGFKVFGREQGGGTFDELYTCSLIIHSFTDSPLTEGQTYEYFVCSIGLGDVLSDPSAIVNSVPSAAIQLEITDITVDKKNHHVEGDKLNGTGADMVSTISITCNVAPTTIDWSASVGAVEGTGDTVTWKPPTGTNSPGTVTITATANKGVQQDSASVKVFMVEEPIMWEWGVNGKAPNFNSTPCHDTPNAPYNDFYTYLDGNHSVLFTIWDSN